MNQNPVLIQHLGRRTIASVRGGQRQLDAFRDALLRNEFFVLSQTDKTLELGRKIRLLAGDWPMRVRIKRDGGALNIAYHMFVPWSWIVLFGLMVIVFLPFAAFEGAPVAFFLGLGIIALAAYKQRFDLSPDAYWQGPPRKRWDETMRRLILECFGGSVTQ